MLSQNVSAFISTCTILDVDISPILSAPEGALQSGYINCSIRPKCVIIKIFLIHFIFIFVIDTDFLSKNDFMCIFQRWRNYCFTISNLQCCSAAWKFKVTNRTLGINISRRTSFKITITYMIRAIFFIGRKNVTWAWISNHICCFPWEVLMYEFGHF